MPRLFISYSRVDRPFVDDFVPLVRDVWGYENVWFDDNLHGGQIWWEEILSQIAACDIFVYLLTNDSVTSEYCQAEYKEAQRLQKQILPVQIRARTNIPEDLKRIHFVDMSAGIKPQSLNKFHASVSRLSARVASAPPSPLDSQPVPIPSVSDAKPKRKFGAREGVIAFVVAIVAIALVLVLLNQANDSPQNGNATETSSSTNAVALVPTDEPTAIPTVEIVPSDTFTPSPTPESPTFTPSPTATDTATDLPTSTSTPEPPTYTPSPTDTPVPPMATDTATDLPTATSTSTYTDTPTFTNTSVPPSDTPTATFSYTPTFTWTWTNSPVPPTNTRTPASTTKGSSAGTINPTSGQPILGTIISPNYASLRFVPGTYAGQIMRVGYGRVVTVLYAAPGEQPRGYTSNLWYYVEVERGVRGWIFSELISLNDSNAIVPYMTPTPSR